MKCQFDVAGFWALRVVDESISKKHINRANFDRIVLAFLILLMMKVDVKIGNNFSKFTEVL
jgi:hypothetical protein